MIITIELALSSVGVERVAMRKEKPGLLLRKEKSQIGENAQCTKN